MKDAGGLYHISQLKYSYVQEFDQTKATLNAYTHRLQELNIQLHILSIIY